MSNRGAPWTSPPFIIGTLAVMLLVLVSSLFTVYQTENALVLRFGQLRRAITEPGLNIKVPFVDDVVYVDKRILALDSPVEELIASDQKRLVVDAFSRYKIKDPVKFYITLRDQTRARSRLAAIVSSSMRSVLGGVSFISIVRDNRDNLMLRIRDLVNEQTQDFGIEIVDVRIRHADLPEANSQAIYRRMQTERAQEAAEFRARGREIAQTIRARSDKDVTVLLAKARRDSEIMRGTGDGCRNRIFARAYEQDKDFFAFYRSMQFYEKALEKNSTTLLLSPEGSAFLRFLKSPVQSISLMQNSMRKKLKPLRLKIGASLAKTLCKDILIPVNIENKKK